MNQPTQSAVSFFELTLVIAGAAHAVGALGHHHPRRRLNRSLTLPDPPLIATPQAYPLLCINELDMCYFVVGWTAAGTPVGVPESALAAMGHTTSDAKEIKGGGKLTYEMPRMNVSATDP